jgi:2-keto-4-pentenoate hydratase/2-oxohepta-3-ene-1,7-dioic acid hydratase in catechol pathway
MKIVVFGPDKRVGVWAGDLVVDLARASAANPGAIRSPLPADLLGLIEGGPDALADAARIVAAAIAAPAASRAANGVYAQAGVVLHPPHVPGARIACAGGNFADHTAAMAAKRSDMPKYDSPDLKAIAKQMRSRGIWGFWKLGRDAAAIGGDIMYPARTKRLDYEAELAIVIGKTAKDVKAGDLKPYIWGVTLFGDWSIRDLDEGSAILKFAAQKNFDGSFSIGPCIVVGEGIDEANVVIETWVNGERRQHFNTCDMVVSFGEYLEYLSTDFTFHPGDIISGGTAAGTAADSSDISPEGVFAPERFLKPGDSVEIRSAPIGTLAAHIVAKR